MAGKTADEQKRDLMIAAFGQETIITEADLTWDSIREIAQVSPEVLAVYQMGTRHGLESQKMLIGMVLALFHSLVIAQQKLSTQAEAAWGHRLEMDSKSIWLWIREGADIGEVIKQGGASPDLISWGTNQRETRENMPMEPGKYWLYRIDHMGNPKKMEIERLKDLQVYSFS